MIRRVTVKHFKRFREQTFELAESIVLAGPNNSGKTTLLQAIAAWKLGLDRWVAHRSGDIVRLEAHIDIQGTGQDRHPAKRTGDRAGKHPGSAAVKRSGVPVSRADFTAVPLREMNLLWEDRRVTGPGGVAGGARLIEIILEGVENDGDDWSCGLEFQYANAELVYVRPRRARDMTTEAARDFPPHGAKALDIVHVPPLSGIEREEPRRERGMQDLLIGQGRPGEILRNLLWEISEEHPEDWAELAAHMHELFGIDLGRPLYSSVQPFIVCEYAVGADRPLDLASAGAGTLQVLLLLAFLYARPASVILLDEPDAHQHIILQEQVYRLTRQVARSRGGQVIIATHSDVILDATEPDRVVGFLGDTPRVLSHKIERDGLREALKRLTTTDLMLGMEVGAVLYVESESDERILREWARVLDHPAKAFFGRPFVHWLGGRKLKEAGDHSFALRAAFPAIRAICLLDGDNRDEEDEKLANSGLLVLRWHRYEIENYLLQPDAIKRFIGHPGLEDEVDREFRIQVPHGTDLFGAHVSLSRLKASHEFLLPLLAKLRPTPKRDLYLLAAEMRPDEIHPEVIEKLDHIASAVAAGD